MWKISLEHDVFKNKIYFIALVGNTETTCDFDRSCLNIYNNLKLIHEEQDINDWNTMCELSQDLKDCMKGTSRRCRGDL